MNCRLTLLILLLSGIACQNQPVGPPVEIGNAPASARRPGPPPGSKPPKTPFPPELAIVKAEFPAGTVAAGDAFGFDITVTNNGPGIADRVFLTDILPAFGSGWTVEQTGGTVTVVCELLFGSMVCGAYRQGPNGVEFAGVDMDEGQWYTVRITSLNDEDDCGTVTNTATVVAEGASQVADSASVTVVCPPRPELEIVKTGFPLDNTVEVGDPFYFDVRVTNIGTATALRAFLTDDLPDDFATNWSFEQIAGEVTVTCVNVGDFWCGMFRPDSSGGAEFTGVDLAPGESYTLRFTAANDLGDCGTVTNSASIAAENADRVSDDGSVTVICPPE